MFLKKKIERNVVPGEKKTCVRCKHYMLGNFCQQDGRQKVISFDKPWESFCSYFKFDNHGMEQTHKEHTSATKSLRDTAINLSNSIRGTDDEKDNVIPIAVSQQ